MNKKYFFGGFVLGTAAFGTAWLKRIYDRDKRIAMARLFMGGSTAETRCGPIEYAEVGDGPAVLVLHGTPGGYDLGLAYTWPDEELRFIAPSRPGYLRTPLSTGRNFAEQADALAALLDELDLPQAAVIGVSAGGPVALQFAIRHPDRCWALALTSAMIQANPVFTQAMQGFENVMEIGDFIPWLLVNTRLYALLAAAQGISQIDGEKRKEEMLRRLRRALFPFSKRKAGLLNDLRQLATLPPLPLEDIQAPTLLIHGDRDTMAPFSGAQHAAQSIPNTQLMTIGNGSHLAFISHLELTRPSLLAFLKTHSPE